MGRPKTGEVGPAQFLTDEQAALVVKSLAPRERTIFQLCLLTSCRVSEILESRIRDVWVIGNGAEQGATLSQLFLHGGRTKARTARMIPLCDEARALIREWIELYRVPSRIESGMDWLFPGRFPGTHHTYGAFEKALVKVRYGLGLPALRSHSMRRTGLTWDKEGGTDMHTIQDIAGHADLSTTQDYLRKDERAKVEATRKRGSRLRRALTTAAAAAATAVLP